MLCAELYPRNYEQSCLCVATRSRPVSLKEKRRSTGECQNQIDFQSSLGSGHRMNSAPRIGNDPRARNACASCRILMRQRRTRCPPQTPQVFLSCAVRKIFFAPRSGDCQSLSLPATKPHFRNARSCNFKPGDASRLPRHPLPQTLRLQHPYRRSHPENEKSRHSLIIEIHLQRRSLLPSTPSPLP